MLKGYKGGSDGALRRLRSVGIPAYLSWHPCHEFLYPGAFGKMPNASRLEACAPKVNRKSEIQVRDV
jgi:hypothetical protein